METKIVVVKCVEHQWFLNVKRLSIIRRETDPQLSWSGFKWQLDWSLGCLLHVVDDLHSSSTTSLGARRFQFPVWKLRGFSQ